MATQYTSLLGYALPVTGELSGTWGDVVNNSITQLVEDSVAGVATASVASGDWTLTTTGSGASNQARMAILRPTGSPGVTRNIIAPSSSKVYIVDNNSNAAVVLKGAATTGVTVAAGVIALCVWDGSDFASAGSLGTVTSITAGTGLTGGTITGSGTIAIDSTVVTLTGSQTLTNKTLTEPVITGTIVEDIFALSDSSTVDIDPGNGSIQTLTLAGTGRTLTFTNMVNGEAITLMINDGTAGTVTTWNATFVNNNGAAPTLSTTGFTVVSIWKVAGTVYAAVVGNA
jgi:hypothetical protein